MQLHEAQVCTRLDGALCQIPGSFRHACKAAQGKQNGSVLAHWLYEACVRDLQQACSTTSYMVQDHSASMMIWCYTLPSCRTPGTEFEPAIGSCSNNSHCEHQPGNNPIATLFGVFLIFVHAIQQTTVFMFQVRACRDTTAVTKAKQFDKQRNCN